MKQNNDKPTTVAEYIASFPTSTQTLLRQVRKAIVSTEPEAVESISYGIAGYKLFKKPLVYFAGNKNHVGFYATPNGHEAFADAFKKYKQGKGSVQFPINEPLPLDLIRQVVEFRATKIRSDIQKTKS